MSHFIKCITASFLFNFILLQLQAQNIKIFFDYDRHRKDSAQAVFYSIYKQSPDTSSRSGSIETYFINGTLLKTEEYWYTEENVQRYKTTYYYENGAVASITNSISLQYDGEQIAFYPDGKVKWKAVYVKNELKEGRCYTYDGKDTAYYVPADRMPYFPGGKSAMERFISDNLKYPSKAKKRGISGTVEVAVRIDKLGNIESVSVYKSVDPLLDQEALRIIRLMPKWSPGIEKDNLLPMYKIIPVRFEL